MKIVFFLFYNGFCSGFSVVDILEVIKLLGKL